MKKDCFSVVVASTTINTSIFGVQLNDEPTPLQETMTVSTSIRPYRFPWSAVWLFLCFCCAATVPARAANHYIYTGASGSGSGADWTNACTSFSGSCAVSSMVRGDTYYVAGGSYAGPNFNKAASGTTLITVKTATVADHGTATGWSDSFATLVTFTGGITFSTNYWLLDGQTGGGPTNWTGGFGLAVTQTSANPVVDVEASFITVRHISATGNSNSSGGGSLAQDAFAIKNGNNFTVSYYYTNAIGRCPFFMYGDQPITIEYGYVGTYVSTSAAHSEVLSTSSSAIGDIDFRYNLVTHIEGTGGLMWDNEDNHNAQFRIYGNTFYRAPGDNSWDNGGNGIIGGWTGGNGEDNFNMHIYNNSFVNINGSLVFTDFATRFGNNVAENNLFYNVTAGIDYKDFATHDYNHYISSGGTQSEANGSSGTGDPFVNDAGLNFQLTANTPQGLSLSAPYTTDPDGTTRGVSGVWDTGAFQFGGKIPSPPTNLAGVVH
jgi:hypothetical protein